MMSFADDSTGPAFDFSDMTTSTDHVKPEPDSKSSPEEITSSSDAQHAAKALKALSTALGLIANLKRAIACMKDPFKVAHKSQRELHVQNILLLQRRRVPTINVVFARERIILICACISLARDFTDFERRCGWVPKADQLISRITQGKDTAVQTIGKHLNNYIAHQALSQRAPALNLSRRNLDAAVRFGIKLEVLDALAASLGLPPGLSLLMGFECVSFSRLSYATLAYLRQAISDPEVRAQVMDFGDTVGSWWENCKDRYHSQFGAEAAAKRRSSSLSSYGMPPTPNAPMALHMTPSFPKDHGYANTYPNSMAGLASAFMSQPGMPGFEDPYSLGPSAMSQYDDAPMWTSMSNSVPNMHAYTWDSLPTTLAPTFDHVSPQLSASPPPLQYGSMSPPPPPATSYMIPPSLTTDPMLGELGTNSLADSTLWATSWGDVY